MLVRPPLYLTVEEFELLCAKAITANLAPPDFLNRTRRESARANVVAELCRRAILNSLLGVTHFREPVRTRLGSNHPLGAYQRQNLIGARFGCLACRSRKGRIRKRYPALRKARDLRDEAVAKARALRAENMQLKRALKAALEQLEAVTGVSTKKGRAA